jgi:cytochrome P450
LSGARSCLGRRFFETEGIAILTMLVSRYKIELVEEQHFAHETFDQRKERLLDSEPGLTMT